MRLCYYNEKFLVKLIKGGVWMKKGIYIVLLLAALFSFNACASYLPMGMLYTEVSSPMAVANGDLSYSKVGTAMATSVLGLVATGDASIKAAASNGGITKIKFVEYSVRNILGVIGEYTTTVYGD